MRTHEVSGDFGSDLAAAAADAVEGSRQELDALEALVGSVTSSIPGLLGRVRRCTSSDSSWVDDFADEARKIGTGFQRHVDDQRQVLRWFNVAFFGRTGAGKSTLLSVMGQLDGLRVSQGESDWTVDVEPLEWHGCRLYDTPGINGWGRTRSREDLEATARRAVEIADVVLLCFDSQAQQASEFEKVARWVLDYGKPVVAVLNVRNERWRLTDKAPTRAVRENLSRPVREHADHIDQELEAIGLQGVPVVALHAQRALHGRARTPFRGPYPDSLARARERYGTHALVEMSNYSVLEQLLAASVQAGGAALRTTALREGVRRLFLDLAAAMAGFEADAQAPLAALDRGLLSILEVMGYPDMDAPRRHRQLWSATVGGDALQLYEEARGEPFSAPRKGSLQRHTAHLLKSHLAGERAASLRRAEQLMLRAFAQQRRIDSDEFERAVFRSAALEAVVGKVWSQAGEFMQRELDLAVAEGLADVELLRNTAVIRGDAGAALAMGGLALRGAGLAGSAVIAGLMIGAAVNWWNPIGWGAAVAAGFAAWFTGFMGKKAKKKAEEQRARARAQALADARRAVNDSFDDLERRMADEVMKASWSAVGRSLREMLENGIAIRIAVREVARLTAAAGRAADAVAASPGAEQVLADAVAAVVRANSTGEHGTATATTVLLGESWIDEAVDATTAARRDHPDRHLLIDQKLQDSAAAFGALHSMWDATEPNRVAAWLGQLDRASSEDRDLVPILDRARLVGRSLPRTAFLGDYSAGKSSLIKRLLVEAGLPVPARLSVRGGPTTENVVEYRLRRAVLVDTPGFQSGVDDHDRRALEAVSDAAIVVFVLHNNLLIGDASLLDRVLKGGSGNLGKQQRALFLINRSDGLMDGDPADDPQAFLRARRRREAELRRALAARGIDISGGRLFTIASDPFGLVGDAPDATALSYAAGRDWDGIGSLRDAFARAEPDLLERGRPIAALEGAVSRLLGLRAEIENQRDAVAADMRSRASVLGSLEAALRDVETVALSLRAQAGKRADSHSRRILKDTLAATSDELPAMAKALGQWWEDPAFLEDVDRFYGEAEEQINDWYATHSSTIDREVRRASFRGVDLGVGLGFELRALKQQANAARHAGKSVNWTAQIAKKLGNRDAYYALMKKFGVKFKPWGAVKGAQKVAKVGAVLAVVGVVLDGAEWAVDIRNEKKREQARLDAVKFVDESAPKVAEQLLEGEDGPLDYLHDHTRVLGEFAAELEAEQRAGEVELAGARSRIQRIDQLLASASGILSNVGARVGSE